MIFGSARSFQKAEDKPTYDNLGRTVQKTIDYYAGGDVFYGKVSYSYLQRNGYQTALVSQYTFDRGISGTLTSSTYNFTYDLAGNITQITDGSNVIQNKYYYDDLYQLIREDNRALGKTYVWTYDNAGNILSKTTYAFTTGALGAAQEALTYTYSNGSWGDQLTSVDGWTYTYDAIGNPISKTNSNGETVEFTWSGRELTSWYLYDDGELVNPMSFTYNADGIRTSKSYYDEVTEYILDGSRIIAEIKNDSHVFVYIYDELGLPVGIKYRTSNTSSYEYFFFEKNLQGDIVAIYNDSGAKIATYTYDAWGNFTKSQTSNITYSTADSYVYNNNPFTYRSYYYDSETGLYYLQTRYYDASIGRFISADGYVNANGDLVGFNMFAYCGNNPVNGIDPNGESLLEVFGKVLNHVVASFTKAVVEVISDIKDIVLSNLTLKVGIGIGMGGSVDVADASLEAVSKMDLVTVSLEDGELNISQEGRSALTLGLLGCTVGPQNDTREHFNGYEDRQETDTYWWDYDLKPSVGKSAYFVIGYSYEVSYSFSGLISDLADYFFGGKIY